MPRPANHLSSRTRTLFDAHVVPQYRYDLPPDSLRLPKHVERAVIEWTDAGRMTLVCPTGFQKASNGGDRGEAKGVHCCFDKGVPC